jgi:hypothetical protein
VPYIGSQPEVSVQIIGKPKIGASQLELEIITEGIPKQIWYNNVPVKDLKN